MGSAEGLFCVRLREAGDEELIIADGFSCKTQIEQGTERRALHLAQVLQLALRGGQLPGERPEEQFERQRQQQFHNANVRAATAAACVGLATLVSWRLLSKRRAV